MGLSAIGVSSFNGLTGAVTGVSTFNGASGAALGVKQDHGYNVIGSLAYAQNTVSAVVGGTTYSGNLSTPSANALTGTWRCLAGAAINTFTLFQRTA